MKLLEAMEPLEDIVMAMATNKLNASISKTERMAKPYIAQGLNVRGGPKLDPDAQERMRELLRREDSFFSRLVMRRHHHHPHDKKAE